MENDEANRLKNLMKEKDSIEAEIKELMDVLESQKGVGLTGTLVDTDDFPRSDIDIYTVRHSRQRVICLQGDHKRVMAAIERGLHTLHEKARSGDVIDINMDTTESDDVSKPADSSVAFLRVDTVEANSPASEAGLQTDDLVIQLGSVHPANYQGLASIGQLVQHSKNKAITVKVARDGKEVRLTLTPKTWSGRGLLGCHIIPLR